MTPRLVANPSLAQRRPMKKPEGALRANPALSTWSSPYSLSPDFAHVKRVITSILAKPRLRAQCKITWILSYLRPIEGVRSKGERRIETQSSLLNTHKAWVSLIRETFFLEPFSPSPLLSLFFFFHPHQSLKCKAFHDYERLNPQCWEPSGQLL